MTAHLLTHARARWPARLVLVCRAVLGASAAYYLCIYVILALLRMPYPFLLEAQEGVSLSHVQRILAGQGLYAAPSVTFTPFIYTPGYFYLSAGVSRIFGPTLPTLRLVSFLASLGTFLLLFQLLRRETQQIFPALVGCGLLAATYQVTEVWFDIARVDSLCLFFMITTLYLVRQKPTLRGYTAAGICAFLAFLTKQTALTMVLPLMLILALTDFRRSLFFTGTCLLLLVTSTALFDHLSHGWYRYYVFTVPRAHPSAWQLRQFVQQDIVAPFAVAAVIAFLYLVVPATKDLKRRLIYASVLGGITIGAWGSRSHAGGGTNVLIPLYAGMSVVCSLGLAWGTRERTAPARGIQYAVAVLLYGGCLWQFIHLAYAPFSATIIPSAERQQGGERLATVLATAQGPVFAPDHAYLLARAGHPSSAYSSPLLDILRGSSSVPRTQLLHQLTTQLQQHTFTTVVLGAVPLFDSDALQQTLEGSYEQYETIDVTGSILWRGPTANLSRAYVYVYRQKR